MLNIDKLLSEVSAGESTEKLELIDKLLASVYPVSKGVEVLWSNEAEERIATYKNGNIPTLDEKTTFAKYKK